MKKVLSLVLALTMVLALAVPAFASGTTIGDEEGLASGGEFTMTASVSAATINVTVPGDSTVTLNPYQLEVTVDSKQFTDQVISANQFVVSGSTVPLDVTAEVTGTPAGTLTFASASAKASTKKDVYAYLQTQMIGESATAPTSVDWGTKINAKTDIVIAAKAAKLMVGTLAAKGTNNTYMAFRIAGDAATAPTTPWSADDGFTAAVKFTFAPKAATPAA